MTDRQYWMDGGDWLPSEYSVRWRLAKFANWQANKTQDWADVVGVTRICWIVIDRSHGLLYRMARGLRFPFKTYVEAMQTQTEVGSVIGRAMPMNGTYDVMISFE